MKQLDIDAALEDAKLAYKTKVESLFHLNNMRDAWKGLKMLTGQDQTKQESSSSVAPSLPVQESVQRLFAPLPPNRYILCQFSQIFLWVKSQII